MQGWGSATVDIHQWCRGPFGFRIPSVRRLDLKLGFACNNRCVFCAQGEKRQVCGARSFHELVRELQAGRAECSSVVLTGGEPTVYQRVVRLVQAAKLLGYRSIQLQTNGRLLSYEKVVHRLVDAGVSEFSPSLHGSTAEVHDPLTGAQGSFAESLAGIRNSLATGLPVVTNSVVTQTNLADLPRLVRLLAETGVRQAQLAFVHPVGTALAEFDRVVPRLSDMVQPLTEAKGIAEEHGMRLVTEAVPLCFLPGMQELAVEDSIPETTVVDIQGTLDYSGWRVAEGKVHGPPCESCSARARCEGPWREYPEHRGWSEFAPI